MPDLSPDLDMSPSPDFNPEFPNPGRHTQGSWPLVGEGHAAEQ